MPPTYSFTGFQNAELSAQLRNWAEANGSGICGDSGTGYVLPNGARRSPDASWTEWSRIRALPKAQRAKYLYLCPDFVVELMSQTDRARTARAKMQEWIANGAQLGWLIDPGKRTVEIYRPDREPELLDQRETVAGEGPVVGFVLDLTRIWRLAAD